METEQRGASGAAAVGGAGATVREGGVARVASPRDSGLARAAALAVLSLAGLHACAGASSRCGSGSISNARRNPNEPQDGPYCLAMQAEGEGTISMQLNRPPPEAVRARRDDDGEPATANLSGPISYTLAAATGANWVDICSAPGARRVLATVDDRQEQIPEAGAPPIPFPVRLYNQVAAPPFTVSSNGWLSFAANASSALSGTIPSSQPPNLLVAGFWADLYTRYNGICYGTTGSAPNRRFVVQWQDLHFCCSDNPAVHLTFEVVIHEIRRPRQNNVIDVIYQQMDGVQGMGVSNNAGLENADGTQGVVIPAPFTVPRAVRFNPSR